LKSGLFSSDFANQYRFPEQPRTRRLAIGNPGAAMVNLAGAVSNPPTQAQAQLNRDKINELLNSLRAAGIINS
jgi:hypothetical protein